MKSGAEQVVMDASRSYEELIEADVIQEQETCVSLTEEFEKAVADQRLDGSSDDGQENVYFKDQLFNAYNLALQEFLEDPDVELTSIIPILVSVHHPPTRSQKTPAGFAPVRGEFVEPLTSAVPASVVYVWQDDCDPCDSMSDNLSGTIANRDEILLLSVFGPDDAQLLYDEFGVTGAPTTLFFEHGTVKARLLGSKPTPTIVGEVKAIKPST